MRIVSINLNKRLGNRNNLTKIHKWLLNNKVDLFLVQEPWIRGRKEALKIPCYTYLGGSDSVGAWIHETYAPPDIILLKDNWLQVKLDDFEIHNVYLSAYSSKERIAFLRELDKQISKDKKLTNFIIGDFNLAPTPEDGLFGEEISDFTKKGERVAFQSLLSKNKLLDMTLPKDQNMKNEFTVERNINNRVSRFRCDLALVSESFSKNIRIYYDHTVRTHDEAFTNHSAIVSDLPPLIKSKFTSKSHNHSERCNSYKTAITSDRPSRIARVLVSYLKSKKPDMKVNRILDYGCGKGRDLKYYESELNCEVKGWDPYEPFGFSQYPNGKYDIVTCVFVLNVVPEIAERYEIIKKALSYVKKNGFLLIATRSAKEINDKASKGGWKSYKDGYWSSEKKHTFQKGIDAKEIKEYLDEIGVISDMIVLTEIKVYSTTVVLVKSLIELVL